MTPNQPTQTASTILMIRPVKFGFNEETADTNAFQREDETLSPEEIQDRALTQFNAFVDKLRAAKVQVVVVDDTETPHTPDSIFPNNWISFHEDGRVVLYPMFAPNRRQERREDLLPLLQEKYNVEVKEVVDLTYFEEQGKFLESTGSMILDRVHKIAYACLSPRTDRDVLAKFCQTMGYEAVAFAAADQNGVPIYHTNVMMSVGEGLAVICAEAIPDPQEREGVLAKLAASRKEVIEISFDQMNAFAGNMLHVHNQDGNTLLVMSVQAYRSLTQEQISRIEAHTAILHADIGLIEQYGGGSVRCMMAEVFNPTR
jgi:hypothetical protein